ncbi:MAG TPA: DUF1576 domain-containing protein [Clostridiaceae bacterium]|nr:DUF1576 domain-containing protein [Clostridiaceae bacterium]
MAKWLSPRYKQAIDPTRTFVRNADDAIRYNLVLTFALLILASSFIFNTPTEILFGLQRILVSPSILVSDYFEIGNIGASFMNSGILFIVGIALTTRARVSLTGPVIAALVTVAGFAFFGKNLYNVWAVPLGVFIYSQYKKDDFGKYILFALFGTALGPMVSLITFGMGFPVLTGALLGNLCGIMAGFFISPLAVHFVNFHQGYNLYNIGFTAGIIGTFFMGVFRAFGYAGQNAAIVASGNNLIMAIYLYVLFTIVLLLGLYLNKWSLKGLRELFCHSGKLVSDFILMVGLGVTLINMALLGIISTTYVLLVGGQLNGPIIGGIFTIFGFAAFGKHVKNCIPIFIGVYIAALLGIFNPSATGPMLAALFGTTLAPIGGGFGWAYGVLAGFLHMAMVSNVGYLHGGMNLYNNGFSGGLVAAGLIPLIEVFRKKKQA